MSAPAERWTRLVGSGIIFEGRCVIRHVLFLAVSANDYIDIYDGRDATAGKEFGRFVGTSATARIISLGGGTIFDAGIYITSSDDGGRTTVLFDPLPE